jgi:hypothetical protein
MHVSVVETGQDRPLPCVNLASFWAGQSVYFGRGAEGDYPFAENGQGFRGGPGRIHGVDGGINDNEIGREQWVIRLSGYQVIKFPKLSRSKMRAAL